MVNKLNWNVLDAWDRVGASGLYTHMITTSFGYELRITCWHNTMPIQYADAVLTIATDKTVSDGILFRRADIFTGSVEDCITYAIDDCNKRLLRMEETGNEKNNN